MDTLTEAELASIESDVWRVGRLPIELGRLLVSGYRAQAERIERLESGLTHIEKHESGEWPLTVACEFGATPGAIARAVLNRGGSDA